MARSTSPAEDRRSVRTRTNARAAALELLADLGVEAVTMEAVAVRAGVSRSTLYRHWRSSYELIIDAFDACADKGHRLVATTEPEKMSPAAHLQMLIERVGDDVRSDAWRLVITALASPHANRQLKTHMQRMIMRPHQEALGLLKQMIEGMREAPGNLDGETAARMLLGPIYYHGLVLDMPLSVESVTEHIELTFKLLRIRTAERT